MIHNIKIAHINIRSLYGHLHDFKHFLQTEHIDICSINETNLKTNMTLHIQNYTIYRQDNNENPYRSIALIVHNNINSTIINKNSTIHKSHITIQVNTHNNHNINITSLYLANNTSDYNPEFDTTRTIFLGDFNSRHRQLGDTFTNKSGQLLLQHITKYNIHVHNNSSPTRINPSGKHSIIDYILSTHDIHHKIHDFYTTDDFTSDHRPILATVHLKPTYNTTNKKPRYDYMKADWKQYTTALLQNIPDITTEPHTLSVIDNNTESIINNITQAANTAIPQTKTSHIPNTLPKHILLLIHQRKYYRKLYRTTNIHTFKAIANDINKNIKSSITSHRKQQHINRLNKLEHITDRRKFWREIKNLTHKHQDRTIPSLKHDNIIAHTDQHKADLFKHVLQHTHAPNINLNSQHTTKINAWHKNLNTLKPSTTIHKHTDDPIDSPITLQEIQDTLAHCKNTAPGHDNIQYILIQAAPPPFLQQLAHLYTSILNTGYIPNTFKKSSLILIHKPQKTKDNPDNYRPIHLLPTLSKLLEKIINNRLTHYIEEHDILPHFQSGFRHQRSTIDNLTTLTYNIIKNMNNKKHTVALFLDLSKAFDKVWIEGLILKLHKLNINSNIIRYINSLLNNRTCHININNKLASFTPYSGTPQGSTLSPTLYNIYTHDIPDINDKNSNITLFADDIALYTSHRDNTTTARILQTHSPHGYRNGT